MTQLKKLDTSKIGKQSQDLQDFLLWKIVNQERAVNRLVYNFDLAQSPLKYGDKPIFAGLLLGPSGVGKTAMAERTAEFLLGSKKAFMKIECENYAERHEVSKLLGAPPGYIGHENRPLLSQENINQPAREKVMTEIMKKDEHAKNLLRNANAMRDKFIETPDPEKNIKNAAANKTQYLTAQKELQDYINEKIKVLYSIILFDEIEKAHRSLHNILLEIIDKGRTRLSNGEEVTFVNSLIFMTSNTASFAIANKLRKKNLGFIPTKNLNDSIYSIAMKEVRKIFSSEFIGRIQDDITVFNSLSEKNLEDILEIQIVELQNQLTTAFPVELLITPEVKKFILEKSTDHPELGARVIEKKLKKHVAEPLARLYSSHQIKIQDTILIEIENNEVVFLKDLHPRLKRLKTASN